MCAAGVCACLRVLRCSLLLPDSQPVPPSDAGGESSSFPLLSSLSLTRFRFSRVAERGAVTQQSITLVWSRACFVCTTLGGKGSNSVDMSLCQGGRCVILPGSGPSITTVRRGPGMTLCDVKGIVRSWLYSRRAPAPASASLSRVYRPVNHNNVDL